MVSSAADVTADLDLLLADVRELVEVESPSSDLDAVAVSAGAVARAGERLLGVRPEHIVVDGVVHLRWRFGAGPTRVLLLGHHDTVWPTGTLAVHPCDVVDGVLRGPGCFDMKAGVVMAFHAVASLAERDGVTILVTGDEEIGSPTSRALIESEASGAVAALVLEASADGGALKTARKGTSLYEVEVVGRAAHAGLEPEKGVNATIELAHQVHRVAALADEAAGTTVTPTAVTAGTTSNTVPAAGRFAVDVEPGRRPSWTGSTPACGHSHRRFPARRWCCTAASTDLRWRSRPPGTCSSGRARSRPGGPAPGHGRRRRRRLRRQLHGRCRGPHPGRPGGGGRRRARRGRARPRGPSSRPHRAGRLPSWPTC